ncbi:hypothetical protein ACP4OV_014823 [Aristida adscensionis]
MIQLSKETSRRPRAGACSHNQVDAEERQRRTACLQDL